MLKIEINRDNVNLVVKGKGIDILSEGVALVYVMAKEFKSHGDNIVEFYRNFLIDELSDKDKFYKRLNGEEDDSDTTEDDLPFM